MSSTPESFSFGDSPALADELAALVLAGKKTATCWAAVEGLKTEVGKQWMALMSLVDGGQGQAAAATMADSLGVQLSTAIGRPADGPDSQ